MRQGRAVLLNMYSRYRKFGIYFFVFIVLVIGGIGYANRQVVYDQLYSWKLIPRPERLTELYFTDHQALPALYHPDSQVPVAFTVHNLESRVTTYTYHIQQQNVDQSASRELAAGTFTLGHDATQAVIQHIALADMGERSRVLVVLSYDGIAFGQDNSSKQSQSIYYWATKEVAHDEQTN